MGNFLDCREDKNFKKIEETKEIQKGENIKRADKLNKKIELKESNINKINVFKEDKCNNFEIKKKNDSTINSSNIKSSLVNPQKSEILHKKCKNKFNNKQGNIKKDLLNDLSKDEDIKNKKSKKIKDNIESDFSNLLYQNKKNKMEGDWKKQINRDELNFIDNEYDISPGFFYDDSIVFGNPKTIKNEILKNQLEESKNKRKREYFQNLYRINNNGKRSLSYMSPLRFKDFSNKFVKQNLPLYRRDYFLTNNKGNNNRLYEIYYNSKFNNNLIESMNMNHFSSGKNLANLSGNYYDSFMNNSYWVKNPQSFGSYNFSDPNNLSFNCNPFNSTFMRNTYINNSLDTSSDFNNTLNNMLITMNSSDKNKNKKRSRSKKNNKMRGKLNDYFSTQNIEEYNFNKLLSHQYRDIIEIDLLTDQTQICSYLLNKKIENKFILSYNILESLKTSMILYDGLIFKVVDSKDGFKLQKRYFQITKNSFKYYIDYEQSIKNKAQPLVQFDIRSIKPIQNINPEFINGDKGNVIKYCFCIYLNINSDFFVFGTDCELFGINVVNIINLLRHYYEDKSYTPLQRIAE